jgi:5-methylcytosine-specific restriction enzyme A
LIFTFTGQSGAKHGYADNWTPEGVYRYFGKGQLGHMRMTGANKAIANHATDGEDICLFETRGKGMVRFLGTLGAIVIRIGGTQ